MKNLAFQLENLSSYEDEIFDDYSHSKKKQLKPVETNSRQNPKRSKNKGSKHRFKNSRDENWSMWNNEG